MAWAEFWEMFDGRTWWELKKSGQKEPRKYTEKQAEATKNWIQEKAAKAGWL